MLSCDSTQEEHDRALKRVKVDNAVPSRCTANDCTAPSHHDSKRSSGVSLSPPSKAIEGSTADDDDDHDRMTAEDFSSMGSGATSKCPSHEQQQQQQVTVEDEDEKRLQAAPLVSSPTRPGGSLWRTSARQSVHHATATTTTTSSVSAVPLPVFTNGAVTTLHSLSQLAILVSSTNTSSAKERTHPDLRLRPGESVMLLLYFDESSLRPLVNAATSELSQMRVFTMNLAKLPPQDYEASFGKRLSTGSVVFHTSVHSTTATRTDESAGHGASTALALLPAQDGRSGGDVEEEDEEEEVLVPAVHPMAVSTAAAEASGSAERERPPRTSAAATGSGSPLPLDEAASVSSLSCDLQHASDVISEKLRLLLSVDTILNPHTLTSSAGGDSSTDGDSSKREPLLFPAMIVWRAAGAPREEYPPAPPQTYSSQPLPTPAELFCDRMSIHGGPLVVKEATSIDQVHSLTLFRPVYTMENLFRTLVRTVAPSFTSRASGDKSRTVLYLGASWCPPCMRFVHEMPQFVREDLPSSVVCTVKADMDLAKPVYDFFKVEIIPTFVVLDNEVLMRCYDSLEQRTSAETSVSAGTTSQSEYLRSIQEAFTKAELARLQNSNRQLVATFVSKHSQTLSFDEDF